MTTTSDNDFAARLDRIKASSGARPGPAPVPPRAQELATSAAHPVSLLAALVLGLVAAALGELARFHLLADVAEFSDPMIDMAVTLGIALALSCALSLVLRLASVAQLGAQIVGVVLMVSGFHNLAHWLPGPMAQAFSPAYVQLAATAPQNSLRFGATYVPLLDAAALPAALEDAASPAITDPIEEPAAKDLPKVRKAGKIVGG